MEVKIITPSGFCMGVDRAISMLNDIIKNNKLNKKIYCLHEIVHNPGVVSYFQSQGVCFIDSENDITDVDSIVCFSAHGVNKFRLKEAIKKYYKVVNLECPLVTKVYNEVRTLVNDDRIIFYIAKNNHQEAEQVIEFIRDLGGKAYVFMTKNMIPDLDVNIPIGIVTQTTLNYKNVVELIDEIKSIYINVKSIDKVDICKATYDRQTALINELDNIDELIVLGGQNSSNTKELVKIGETYGKKVYFIHSYLDTKKLNIDEDKVIGVTGGASTPINEIYKVGDILLNENKK